MSWAKLDDGFPTNPKVAEAGGDAAWLHICALCYCAQHLTDGRFPKTIVGRLSDRRRPDDLAARLVALELWHDLGDEYEIHDYLEYNPSRERTLTERRKAKERRANVGRTSGDVPPNVIDPVPSRPESPTDSSRARKRAHRIPEDFAVSESMRAWANERVPGVDLEHHTERFVNFWQAKSGKDATKLDWPATWRNWMLQEYGRSLTPTVVALKREPSPVLPPSESPMCETCLRSVLACVCVSANGRGTRASR